MALEIKFEKTKNPDGDTLLLKSITGVYDVNNNPGGFGAPNLEREDVNLVPYVTFGPNGSKVDPGSYIPDASLEIPIPLIGDGVYPITVFALPVAYDYTGASLADLQANAVSTFTFDTGHFQDLKAARKKYSLLEEMQNDSCNNKEIYRDEVDEIDLQIFGAQSDLCNDLEVAAHNKLINLTTYIDNLRI